MPKGGVVMETRGRTLHLFVQKQLAGSRGGGIYAQETNISFSGTGLLSGNKAQLDGGGIYADGSNLNFSANP